MAAVVARMRPAWTHELLRPVLDLYDRLLTELLGRGSATLEADAMTMLDELDFPVIRACAQSYVYEHELGRLVATVAHHREGPVGAAWAKIIWPVELHQGTPTLVQLLLVIELVRRIRLVLPALALGPNGQGLRGLLVATGEGWPVETGFVPAARGKGRPANLDQQHLLYQAVREGLFPQGVRPCKDVAAGIAAESGGRISQRSVYRKMAALWRDDPIPAGWHSTLLCKRIAPLYSPRFSGQPATWHRPRGGGRKTSRIPSISP